MAKRKTSKAKASRPVKRARAAKASQRKRPPVDPVTGHYLLFDPVTGEPTQRRPVRQLTAKEQAKRKREENERCDASRLRREESRARARAADARREQLGVEPLPRGVEGWLLSHIDDIGSRVNEVSRYHGLQLDARVCETVKEWAVELYLEGCRRAYIEGRLAEIAARQQVGAGKQRKTRANLVPFDGVKIPMDERDAKIFVLLPEMRRQAGTADEGDELMGERGELTGKQVRNIHFEQTVLRERAALVQQGLGENAASERIVNKYGVDKHGKPRHKKVRDILAKAPQRMLPEVH